MSMVRAADALHVSQPAVSKTVRELEEALGIALVARDGRGIRITREGEIFLQHAITAISALRQGINSVVGNAGEAAPLIRIGALPTVSSRIMPSAIKRFLDNNSIGKVEISTGDNDRLLEQLRVGELDLVVGRLAEPESMKGLTFEHLYSEQIAFVVRPGHPLLSSDPFEMEDLQSYPIIMPTRRSIIRRPVEQFLIARGAGALNTGRVDTVSDSFGRAFVRQSDAVWIISEGVVRSDIADRQLIKLPIDTSETRGPVGLTMLADISPLPHLSALIHAIRWAAQGVMDPQDVRNSGN